MNPFGILKIDLDKGRCSLEKLAPRLVKDFLGGRGLGFRLMREYLTPGSLPLAPQTPLIFSTGLLAGTGAPASGRLQLTGLSPASGLLGSSNAGGYLAAHLATNGLMALFITGQAEKPVVLRISNGRGELLPAGELWGLDAWETGERLGESRKVQVAAIGPAGENLVPLACVMLGRHSAAGRTGLGAVMGAKRLKAVVVETGPAPREAMPAEAREAVGRWLKELRRNELYEKTSQEGQSGYLPWAHEMGVLSTRNFQEVSFSQVEAFDSPHMLRHREKRRGCARCPVNCKADMKIKGGAYGGLTGPRPEFETLASLGPRCGIHELEAVCNLNNRCGQLGLDTVSAGAAIAFAMDLFEQGIIGREETGGLNLKWGDPRTAELVLEQMALRRGFGGILSQGVVRAAQKIGGRALEFAYTVKGLELTAYDPRTLKGTSLGYAVAGRGGDFGSFFSNPEYRWSPRQAREELGKAEAADRFSDLGKPQLIRRGLLVNAVLDSLGLCKVPSLGIMSDFSLRWEARLVTALGLGDYGAADLLKIGERIVNLERLLNFQLGAGPQDDRLPARFSTQPAPSGPAQGRTVDLEGMLQKFYGLMGWDGQGRPTLEKLQELGLEPVTDTARRRSA